MYTLQQLFFIFYIYRVFWIMHLQRYTNKPLILVETVCPKMYPRGREEKFNFVQYYVCLNNRYLIRNCSISGVFFILYTLFILKTILKNLASCPSQGSGNGVPYLNNLAVGET